MTTADKRPFEDILEEASNWMAREVSGEMTALEQEELETLLEEDADFQLAYLELYKPSHLIDYLATSNGKEALKRSAPELLNLVEEYNDPQKVVKQISVFRRMASLAAIFTLLLSVTAFFFQDNNNEAVYKTEVGGTRNVMLADGSIITLNTDSSILVALSNRERKILLENGEAYFQVAKDKDRPFIVIVNDDAIRAVGTAFNIKNRSHDANIVVTEGKVEVTKAATTNHVRKTATPLPISLVSGQELALNDAKASVLFLNKREIDQKVSWRKGIVHFNRRPLREVVSELQHYEEKEIIFTNDDVKEIIVGGSFNSKNISSFLKALELNFPVQIIQRDTVIIISPRKA